MAKTHVRSASDGDFPTLLQIDQASFPPGIAYDSSELSYFMRRDGSETLVVESDGEIAGFILVEIRRRKKSATMITLDVRAEHRRRGYATSLLVASEEILRKRHVLRYELQVDVNNSPAIEFYTKHGFETVCTLKGYYPNGNDAYLMVKRLEGDIRAQE
jgi:ribosomal-protein-alanine N-acetyltransferase